MASDSEGEDEGHPRFHEVFTFRSARTGVTKEIKASDLYHKTAASTLAYRQAGYRVVTVWSDEFMKYEKLRGGGTLREIMDVEDPIS